MYVLMVVPNDFPNGDAGSIRDLSFASIYQMLGYDVILIGAGNNSKSGDYKSVQYYSVYKEINGLLGHIYRFIYYPQRYISFIKDIEKKFGVPSAIHINDVAEVTINYLKKYAIKHDIPIVHDSVEWYSASEFAKGKLDKAYILKNRLNTKIIKKPIKVYAISSYLENYFRSKGLNSIRIPVIMDIEEQKKYLSQDEDVIKLIYAGSPGKKDYLREIVLGIEMLNDNEKRRLRLDIYGASTQQVKSIIGSNTLSPCIYAHGRVQRCEVESALQNSDFSVLLRPEYERYAKAGFPTKSVEAMVNGVAMLCNLSSDLDIYLKDMKNSVIVDGHTPELFCDSIKRILELDRNTINVIKRNARITAENNFDYRLWKDAVNSFLFEGSKA